MLAAAIAIGLAAEVLLFAGASFVGSKLPQPWDERLWAVTQEPASHLVDWLAKAQHPGFEEQGAYVLLIPLTQWIIWSGVFYLILSRKRRNASV